MRVFKDYSPTIRTPKGGGHLPLVAMRWVRSEKGREARQEAMKEGKDYTPFGSDYRELAPAEEDISGCFTGALNRDTLVANTVDADGYLRRGARDRDEEGKAIPTSINTRRIRRLTPTECERLQGFPDGWTEGLSDTQRYKTLGNAVTVNVTEFLGQRIWRMMENE